MLSVGYGRCPTLTKSCSKWPLCCLALALALALGRPQVESHATLASASASATLAVGTCCDKPGQITN